MCERVVRIVHEGLAECEDPEIFLGTKFKVLTFVQTLEVGDHPVESMPCAILIPFLDILTGLRVFGEPTEYAANDAV